MALYSISDMANEFDISTRTIRYYEERGLLSPDQTKGRVRMYGKKGRTRLLLILRGKRFGFSLEEIKTMIELFEEDRSGQKQLEQTIAYGRRKVREISEQIEEMTQLKAEMESMLHEFESRLKHMERAK